MAKPETTGRDYGRKLYMNTTGYPEAIGRPGDKQYDNAVKRPHSDDKKPYMPDEYQEMEHFWTPYDPPNLVPPGRPDDPRIPPMDPEQPPDITSTPDEDDPYGEFTGCVWTIPTGNQVIKRGEATFHGIGFPDNDPLVSLKTTGPIDLLTNHRSVNQCVWSMTPTCFVAVQAKDDFDKNDYTEIADSTFLATVTGRVKSGRTCLWELYVLYCPPDEEFEWDYVNSAETITDNDAVALYVTGGAPPFTWELSGAPGFSLAHQVTELRHNTLISDNNTACGAATIGVTDGCDNQVGESVRNTDRGSWTLISSDCGYAGDDPNGWTRSGLTYGDNWTWYGEVISGKQKQLQTLKSYYGGTFTSGYFATQALCDAHRSSYDLGTINSECLAWESPLWYGSANYGGWYYKVAGRKYAKNCGFSQRLLDLGYDAWSYLYSHFNQNPVSLTYYEWEC